MEIEKQSENISEVVEVVTDLAKPKMGGARPGAGRPKGSLNKISGGDILDSLENVLGIPYAEQLALNYRDALYSGDVNLKEKYDRLILSKVVADKVDITSNGETMREIIQITMDRDEDSTKG
jgi:hypothetical protein